MCEYCSMYKTWKVPLDDEYDWENYGCEWMGDDPRRNFGTCDQSPSYTIHERATDGHLCDEHAAEENQYLDEGLGKFEREFGIKRSVDFLPVREKAECEHIVNAWGGSTEECGKPVTRVKMVIEQKYVYCDEHAREIENPPADSE